MLLDSEYDEYVEYIKQKFDEIIGDVKVISVGKGYKRYGSFKICFMIERIQYLIEFENEYDRFSIRIIDADSASVPLPRLCDYNASLSYTNIENAVKELSQVILMSDIPFVKTENGKTYIKRNGLYKRVKDISKLK
ncbi:MAG: hypothetical protein R3Y24_02700 [Eubacteriales bacterium]